MQEVAAELVPRTVDVVGDEDRCRGSGIEELDEARLVPRLTAGLVVRVRQARDRGVREEAETEATGISIAVA